MYSIYDKRLNNVRKIASFLGGLSALAELLEKERSQVSQIAGVNPTRKIGEELSRKIEQTLMEKGIKQINLGWLDQDHDDVNIFNDKQFLIPLGKILKSDVPGVNSVLSEKDKTKNPEDEKMLDEILKDQMQNMKLEHKNAFWLKIKDDSMKPSFEPGSLTMIDKSRVEIVEGSCYALEIEKNVVLRRIYRENGAYKICCDNPAVKLKIRDKTVKDFASEGINILGKMIWYATSYC